ncbi:MAG: hypothetical protein EOM58_04765 [Clostridia bacterium]|nr:hypothetical protein [Clostridia bacterium]
MKTHSNNQDCSYPRLCAHRGFNMVAPEDTLPAFALAVAMGAQEIELDLWVSKDGHLIVCHDPSVDRTSNGTGFIKDLTLKEIKALDAGSWFSPSFKGVTYPLFEEVLDLAADRACWATPTPRGTSCACSRSGRRTRRRDGLLGLAPVAEADACGDPDLL